MVGTALPSLAVARPELPTALHAALDAALDPDPSARPSVADLHLALESLAGSLHPDRPVPEPVEPPHATPLPEAIPARPFAVLLGLAVLIGARFTSARYQEVVPSPEKGPQRYESFTPMPR